MELTWADKIELRGKQEGMRELLFEQIEERFGALSKSFRQRIEAITSKDELRRLARLVLVANSWEEMEATLEV